MIIAALFGAAALTSPVAPPPAFEWPADAVVRKERTRFRGIDQISASAIRQCNLPGDDREAVAFEFSYPRLSGSSAAANAVNAYFHEALRKTLEWAFENCKLPYGGVAKQDLRDGGERCEVTNRRRALISVRCRQWWGAGPTYPTGKVAYLHFDSSSGRVLKSEDVFTDLDAVKSIVRPVLRREISEVFQFDDVPEDVLDGAVVDVIANSAIEDDGVCFYYSPNGRGSLEFVIPYRAIGPLIRPRYRIRAR